MRLRTLLMLLITLLVVISPTGLVFAESDATPIINDAGEGFELMRDLGRPAIMSVVFTIIGLVFFSLCIWVIVKVTPFSVQKEIEEDQNVAMGIIIGAMILGIAIILAAAMLG